MCSPTSPRSSWVRCSSIRWAPSARSLAGLLTIAVAFVIRPIGAIIFGWIGDRIGRRKTLLVTVLLMGIATGLDRPSARLRRPRVARRSVLLVAAAPRAGSGARRRVGRRRPPGDGAARRQAARRSTPPSRSSAPRSARSSPAALFLVMFATIAVDGMLAWGWRIPFLTRVPAAAGLALPALVDQRDAGVQGDRGGRRAASGCRSPRCSRSSPSPSSSPSARRCSASARTRS